MAATGDRRVIAKPLRPTDLRRATDLSPLGFSTTAELEAVDGLLGHSRAREAIQFGTEVKRAGFNLFVIGPDGARMQDAVKSLLSREAGAMPEAPDWVYVNNFSSPERPVAIELPAGRARPFQAAMSKLVDDLKAALPAAFQSEEYQARHAAIDEAFQQRQGEAFAALHEKAGRLSVVVLRTPIGFAVAPAHNGQVVSPEVFNAWPEEKRAEAKTNIQALEKDLEQIIRQIPRWERIRRDEMRQLNRDTAEYALDQLMEETKAPFHDLPKVLAHIEASRVDLIDSLGHVAGKLETMEAGAEEARTGGLFERYEVNVLVARDGQTPGAPIVEELHPSLGNLIGRIEYLSVRGALVTNFRLIRAGAIHKANGGYLLLDVRSLLNEPFSWPALKRTLLRGDIAIEDASRFLGLTSTVSLEPDPIPLDVKVVLFGERLLYFLLAAFDPDLANHFKVLADFDGDLPRTPENEAFFARLVASLARRDELRPLDRGAVELIMEHASRRAQDAGKLSLVVERLKDLMIEADLLAQRAKREAISKDDVSSAISAGTFRAARLRDRARESILDNVSLIDTDGASVGQVNGLSVHAVGGLAFGRPTRITCQVRPGAGKVVDIEREVKLGGPVHSKGILILSGFIAGRYALDTPMSLFASLVFEQSYGGVEGDSASSAELYALLSALADVPLRQDLAVTGSVNQHGAVQAIGGVNEKIEGFFDICEARGLTGTQGVLIPHANVRHLMLREDVVEACARGRFHVYPLSSVDEGIALLSGLPAGERGDDGRYPEPSVNRRVEDRLRAFADVRRSYSRQDIEAAQRG